MIRMIRTTTLRALQEGAELASVLEEDLANTEVALAAYKADQDDDMTQLQQLAYDLGEVRTQLVAAEARNNDFARLTTLLVDATRYAFDAADAPVDVVLHKGRVHSVHRDRQAAVDAVPLTNKRMYPLTDPDPDPFGWKVQTASRATLPSPERADEITALLERVERPATDRPAEVDRVQELTRELETVRAQRDTAIEDTATLGAAFTSRCVDDSLHRKTVTQVAGLIAMALSAQDPIGSVRDISCLLFQYADVLGIDPHAGPEAVRATETKEVTA